MFYCIFSSFSCIHTGWWFISWILIRFNFILIEIITNFSLWISYSCLHLSIGQILYNSDYCLLSVSTELLWFNGKQFMGDRIHTQRVDWWSTLATHPLCDIFYPLCYHLVGECRHDCLNMDQSSTPHTNVLFPHSLIICGYLLFISYHPKVPMPSFKREKRYFFCRLFYSNLLLWCTFHCRVFPPSHHGLWSLCSHLSPSSLLGHHVSNKMCSTSSHFLHYWAPTFFSAYHSCISVVLLWIKHH